MQKKRILIISTTDFYGGGESFIVNTLSQLPYELSFIVASERLAQELYMVGQTNITLFNSTNFFRRIAQIKSAVRIQHFDTVIFNGGNSLLFPIFIKHHNKVMYKHTTYEAYQNVLKRFLSKLFIELNILASDRIIHVSDYSLQQQILSKRKGIVVYHGLSAISEATKKLSGNKYIILYVGRLDPAKGLPIIIEAVKRMRGENVELWVVGDGVLSEQLKKENDSAIKYFGYQSNVIEFYEKADLFITLPQFEAFGLSILEALSFGLPVVATNVGGIPELITDGDNGLLIKPDVASVINAVRKLLHNAYLYSRFSENAVSVAQKFKKSDTLERLEKIL